MDAGLPGLNVLSGGNALKTGTKKEAVVNVNEWPTV
jgi:hypothetical protein